MLNRLKNVQDGNFLKLFVFDSSITDDGTVYK